MNLRYPEGSLIVKLQCFDNTPVISHSSSSPSCLSTFCKTKFFLVFLFRIQQRIVPFSIIQSWDLFLNYNLLKHCSLILFTCYEWIYKHYSSKIVPLWFLYHILGSMRDKDMFRQCDKMSHSVTEEEAWLWKLCSLVNRALSPVLFNLFLKLTFDCLLGTS